MLEITIPKTEYFKSDTQEFGYYDAQTLKFEHSLISISKWESKWTKPFLTDKQKTQEEILSYIQCMCITPISDKSVFNRLTPTNQQELTDYIAAPMTATWITDKRPNASRRVITSEVIYAQMIGLGIPVEFEKWHINRLLTLIKVCDIMFNDDPKNKMSKKEIYQSNRELNEKRRKELNTTG